MTQAHFQYLTAVVSAAAAAFWLWSAFKSLPYDPMPSATRTARSAHNVHNIEKWAGIFKAVSRLNAIAAALSALAAAMFAFQTFWWSPA